MKAQDKISLQRAGQYVDRISRSVTAKVREQSTHEVWGHAYFGVFEQLVDIRVGGVSRVSMQAEEDCQLTTGDKGEMIPTK